MEAFKEIGREPISRLKDSLAEGDLLIEHPAIASFLFDACQRRSVSNECNDSLARCLGARVLVDLPVYSSGAAEELEWCRYIFEYSVRVGVKMV